MAAELCRADRLARHGRSDQRQAGDGVAWRGERSPETARKLWTRAIRFREALARVLLAKTDGGAPADEGPAADREGVRAAPRLCARLVPSDAGFRWTLAADEIELDSALRPVLESAVALMTSERMARVRRCGNSTCYWLFLDETKNHSRRWCEMASCGNLRRCGATASGTAAPDQVVRERRITQSRPAPPRLAACTVLNISSAFAPWPARWYA